ncbi:MAG: signal peptidase I [Proteobacteria bacterium]|nr:signal peptidase I [Pseudomonadota bacterium]
MSFEETGSTTPGASRQASEETVETQGGEGGVTAAPAGARQRLPRVHGVLMYALQVMILTVLLLHFVGRVSVVQGASMEPGIMTGERIVVDLVTYSFRAPRRGDVVVFRSPRNKSRDYIKRIVGLPGEEIEIREGQTRINGVSLAEPYVTLRDRDDTPRTLIAPTCVWVMGDNRTNSEDSRRWGQLPMSLIRGKASIVLWPPERMAVLP